MQLYASDKIENRANNLTVSARLNMYEEWVFECVYAEDTIQIRSR